MKNVFAALVASGLMISSAHGATQSFDEFGGGDGGSAKILFPKFDTRLGTFQSGKIEYFASAVLEYRYFNVCETGSTSCEGAARFSGKMLPRLDRLDLRVETTQHDVVCSAPAERCSSVGRVLARFSQTIDLTELQGQGRA